MPFLAHVYCNLLQSFLWNLKYGKPAAVFSVYNGIHKNMKKIMILFYCFGNDKIIWYIMIALFTLSIKINTVTQQKFQSTWQHFWLKLIPILTIRVSLERSWWIVSIKFYGQWDSSFTFDFGKKHNFRWLFFNPWSNCQVLSILSSALQIIWIG